LQAVHKKLQAELKATLESFVVKCDNRFSIENFKYVTEELGN